MFFTCPISIFLKRGGHLVARAAPSVRRAGVRRAGGASGVLPGARLRDQRCRGPKLGHGLVMCGAPYRAYLQKKTESLQKVEKVIKVMVWGIWKSYQKVAKNVPWTSKTTVLDIPRRGCKNQGESRTR